VSSFIWLSTGTSCHLFWTRRWKPGFRNMPRNSCWD